MGYTFKIGQLVTSMETYEDEDELGNPIMSEYESHDVESMMLDDAPEFPNDEMTGKSNSRSPSYSTWSNFCKDTGIYGLFYTVGGHLQGGHPGYIDITQQMVDHIKFRLDEWQEASTLPPGFEGFPIHDPFVGEWVTPDEGKYDYTLARLMWLHFWTDWALKNCKQPVIVNW